MEPAVVGAHVQPDLLLPAAPRPTAVGLPLRILAYVGDAVYELHVRAALATKLRDPRALHQAVVRRVMASAQARVARAVVDVLTEEERDIWRRARNHRKGGSRPSPAYRHATAVEAVLGHLYLRGDGERLATVLQAIDQALPEME
jgi:ribonuclease-3 family protein